MNAFKERLTAVAKRYIEADKALRGNPLSWSSRGPDYSTPEGQEYRKLSLAHRAAVAEMWMITDMEYDDPDQNPLAAACWEWRYWGVMARKCCHSQRDGSTAWAVSTMRKLQEAETHLMELLGLYPTLKKVS